MLLLVRLRAAAPFRIQVRMDLLARSLSMTSQARPLAARLSAAFARGLSAALLLALAAGTAPAGANLAVNPSYESGPSPGMAMELPVGSVALDGWVVTRNAIDYCETRWNAAEGLRSVALNGTAPGGIAQNIATVPGGQYTVTFFLGGDAFSAPTLKHVRATAAGASQDYEFDAEHAWPWGMGWLQKTFAFTATAAATTLEFYSLDTGDTGPVIDNVSVTGPTAGVPVMPHGFALAAPYPNPAAQTFDFNFALPAESPVRIAVLDLQGREVAVIADGVYTAGLHPARWNGRAGSGRAPGGLYFIRLEAPGISLVRKAVLSH